MAFLINAIWTSKSFLFNQFCSFWIHVRSVVSTKLTAVTAEIIASDNRKKRWSKVVLQKLMVAVLSKFSSFYGIRSFVLTRTCHWFMFWARWNKSTPRYRDYCNISVNTHITFYSEIASSKVIVAIFFYVGLSRIEKNEMGGACVTYDGRERCAQGFGGETCGKETIEETKT